MRATKEQLKSRREQQVRQVKEGSRVRLTLDLLAGAVFTAPAGTVSSSAGSVVQDEEAGD